MNQPAQLTEPTDASGEVTIGNDITVAFNGRRCIHARFCGEMTVDGRSVGFRAALCRCGASKRKSFCDKSHKYVGFSATGEPPSSKSELDPLEQHAGTLAVEPELDGPLVMQGNVEIVAGSGRTVAITREVRLCRCGASANKPFCDESHRVIDFGST